MKNHRSIPSFPIAILPLIGLAHGANMAIGDGSSLTNSLFINNAATGGDDIRADGGSPNLLWVPQIPSGTWTAGQTVGITGIAIPVWANSLAGDLTNNTDNGTFTFTFYDLGADATWQGTDNIATSDDSLLGSADATFNSANTGVNTFFVNFDSPISFTATNDSLIGIHLSSTSSLRLKGGSAESDSFNLNNGVSNTFGTSMSLAGTVVPEPSVALLGGLGMLGLLRRRRS